MLSKRLPLAVLCAAGLVACDAADSITGPSSSPNPSGGGLLPIPVETEFLPGVPVLDPFALIWNDDAGVAESARGGGHFENLGALRTFAFTAKNRADGTTQGQYQINNRGAAAGTGIKEHGIVTCLEVAGRNAFIGGTITHSSDPLRVGLQRTFRVVDRGEGASSPPDLASVAEFRPAEACHLMLADELHELEGGNIQVTDGT
jgi:hypothetical protein